MGCDSKQEWPLGKVDGIDFAKKPSFDLTDIRHDASKYPPVGRFDPTERKEAMLEYYILEGVPYQEALKRAGLPRDEDPGFHGGELTIEEGIRQRARIEEGIRQGLSVEEAYKKAGLEPPKHNSGDLGRSVEIGERPGDHLVVCAWKKEYLRLGMSPEEAIKLAREKLRRIRNPWAAADPKAVFEMPLLSECDLQPDG
jgi:hypothetical protein